MGVRRFSPLICLALLAAGCSSSGEAAESPATTTTMPSSTTSTTGAPTTAPDLTFEDVLRGDAEPTPACTLDPSAEPTVTTGELTDIGLSAVVAQPCAGSEEMSISVFTAGPEVVELDPVMLAHAATISDGQLLTDHLADGVESTLVWAATDGRLALVDQQIAATTTTTATSPTTTSEAAPAIDDASLSALCGLYINWIDRDDYFDTSQAETVMGYLGDTGQTERLRLFETATNDETDWLESFDAFASFDDSVMEECRDQWLADVPSRGGDNPAAFDVFFEALGTGDRALAATVATQRALASDRWNGWNNHPSADPMDTETVTNPQGTFNAADDTASFLLAPTLHLYCEFADGVVLSCVSGE